MKNILSMVAFLAFLSRPAMSDTINGNPPPANLGAPQVTNLSTLQVAGTTTLTGALTATGGGTISGGTVAPLLTTLTTLTTTQLDARGDALGSIFFAQESDAGALVTNEYNLCMSTGLAANTSSSSYVYIAVSTNNAGGVAAVGGKCNK